eukprot:CAMPEP_0175753722 /NCGR_PEP_ID=MMETSP0097-20121207/62462_1 /TAXON_ID=311494 /ORGANISM="Alexandrium monilatum, Strain CCMP3105" /LENGTH=73 /DNA_ID=CAMNT_0017062617 /DNA_START=33 /DNA_END=251 /DNA_ORIENTATION=+
MSAGGHRWPSQPALPAGHRESTAVLAAQYSPHQGYMLDTRQPERLMAWLHADTRKTVATSISAGGEDLQRGWH